MFTETLKKCRSHNQRYEKGETSFKMTVNSFSVMDKDAKQQFLGLSQNMSLLENGKYYRPAVLQSSGTLQALPESFDWKQKG